MLIKSEDEKIEKMIDGGWCQFIPDLTIPSWQTPDGKLISICDGDDMSSNRVLCLQYISLSLKHLKYLKLLFTYEKISEQHYLETSNNLRDILSLVKKIH